MTAEETFPGKPFNDSANKKWRQEEYALNEELLLLFLQAKEECWNVYTYELYKKIFKKFLLTKCS